MFGAPAPNSTETISLLTLVNTLLRYKPAVTGKFDLGVQKEAEQRLTQFCQENTRVIVNTLPTTCETTLHTGATIWSIPTSD